MPSKPLHVPPGPGAYLTAEEVARLTGFSSIDSLYVNRSRNLLPGRLAVRWRSRLWWRQADIQAYLSESLGTEFERRWAERHQKDDPEPVRTLARELADEKAAANG